MTRVPHDSNLVFPSFLVSISEAIIKYSNGPLVILSILMYLTTSILVLNNKLMLCLLWSGVSQ